MDLTVNSRKIEVTSATLAADRQAGRVVATAKAFWPSAFDLGPFPVAFDFTTDG